MEHGRSPFREGGALRILLVYPNARDAGACNLGFATVFRLLNDTAGVTCERAFADPGLLAGTDLVRSVETGRPPTEFAMVAFSIMSEVDYLHAAAFLERSGIPWRRTDRSAGSPLVVVGGAAPTLNPAPLLPLADLVVRGEAEEDLPGLAAAWSASWSGPGGGSGAVLEASRAWPGATGAEGACLVTLPPASAPRAYLDLIPDRGAFGGMALVEATRGCPWGCRFCSARVLYRPYRAAPLDEIMAYARSVRPVTDHLGLVGAGLAARPDLPRLLDLLAGEGMRASCSSLRLDGLSDEVLAAVVRHGQRTVTVAPESFREETLALLGKPAPSGGLTPALRRVLEAGFIRVKVYMMMGIPGDDPEESVAAAAAALGGLGRLARRVELSYSVFQPKPGAPMANEPLAGPSALKREGKLIRSRLGRLVGGVDLPGYRGMRTVDLLSRGGPDALELALGQGQPSEEAQAASILRGRPWWAGH